VLKKSRQSERQACRVEFSAGKLFPDRGIALLAVLWTLTLLGLVALSLSSAVQDEVRTATYRKDAAQAYAFACGAIDTAIMAIAYPVPGNAANPPFWSWKQGQRESVVPFAGGRARLEIENESGKLDLNFATDEELVRLFLARGVAPAPAQELAAAILHWRLPKQDDAESAALDKYYQAAGIRPRHGRFQSVEELLNVRGISPELYYGAVEVLRDGSVGRTYGAGQDLTVMSGSSAVNVNYASEYVLESLPGMTVSLAKDIVRERTNAPFRSVPEVGDRLAVILPDEALPYLTTTEGGTYRIRAVGELAGSAVRRAVQAVVQVDPMNTLRHRVVAWYDDAAVDD